MWRWISDGDKSGLQLDDEFYLCKGIAPKDKLELSNRLHLQSAVWGILYSARSSFAVGNANYADAVENLTTLVAELFKALSQLEDTMREVFGLLDGMPTPDISHLNNTAMDEKIKIAKEIVLNAPPPIKKTEAKAVK